MIFNTIYGSAGESYKGDTYDFSTRTLGFTVVWNLTDWIIVNIEENIYTLALKTLTAQSVYFGSNNVYKGSLIENQCKSYEGSVAASSLALAIPTEVLGTTNKIYIPTSECFAADAITGMECNRHQSTNKYAPGTYQYYSNQERKKWQYDYWTASNVTWTGLDTDTGSNKTDYVWVVGSDGALHCDGKCPGYSSFRPHVRVQL